MGGLIVQRRNIKIALAVLLTLSLLLVLVPAAVSQANNKSGHNGKGNATWDVDEIYSTVALTGAKADSTTYNILNNAIKGKDGKVAVMNFTVPLSGTYYKKNDTAFIVLPMDGKKPVIGSYSNATINPAGGFAVIVMKNITRLSRVGNTTVSQFTDLAVYLPDGSVKSYKLEIPVKITSSMDTRLITINSNPHMRMDIQDAIRSRTTFPANAKPVLLKDIDARSNK
jgi:hypothetical protein